MEIFDYTATLQHRKSGSIKKVASSVEAYNMSVAIGQMISQHSDEGYTVLWFDMED